MSNISIVMQFEPQRSLAFGSIGAAYMGVGTAVNHPVRQFLIQNLTNADMQFSFDGVNDHFPIPSGGFFLSDITSNKALGPNFCLPEGSRLYVKQLSGAAGSGSVYFTVIYAKE
jgi:hypothetical protein